MWVGMSAELGRHGCGGWCHRPPSTSTPSDRYRTLGIDEAARRPDSERLRAHAGKTPRQRGRHAGRERPGAHPGDRSTRLTSRSSVGRCFQKCHWPGYPFPPADRRLPGTRAGGPGLRAEPSAAAPRCDLRPDFQGFGEVLDNGGGRGGSLSELGCGGSFPRKHIKRKGSGS
jgi:hypothetical protein